MGELLKVAKSSQLPPGGAICVNVKGHQIALFNVDGSYYAIDDTCPHSGGSLSEGDVEGRQIVCPLHGATFDLADGTVLTPPADENVVSYRVEVDGDDVKVEIP